MCKVNTANTGAFRLTVRRPGFSVLLFAFFTLQDLNCKNVLTAAADKYNEHSAFYSKAKTVPVSLFYGRMAYSMVEATETDDDFKYSNLTIPANLSF